MTMRPVITLLTDFGTRDPFVAEMKAVILSICPEATIVDISHDVEKFNIRHGAFVLACAYRYFPKRTIHVVVVDPGVGTERRPIVIKTRNYYFIGPDNGVLLLAADEDGIEEVREIKNPRYMLPQISTTFHGRDIFAPAAAYIARGVPLRDLGPELKPNQLNRPKFSTVEIRGNAIEGEVLHIDSFGNVITNIKAHHLDEIGIRYGMRLLVKLPDLGIELEVPFVKSYGYVDVGKELSLIDSHDFLELAINQGSFCSRYGVRVGMRVIITKCD